jgi:hypothetical protein
MCGLSMLFNVESKTKEIKKSMTASSMLHNILISNCNVVLGRRAIDGSIGICFVYTVFYMTPMLSISVGSA